MQYNIWHLFVQNRGACGIRGCCDIIVAGDESDLFIKCANCGHQRADHDASAKKDKRKCLIGRCECKAFIPDRKYYKK